MIDHVAACLLSRRCGKWFGHLSDKMQGELEHTWGKAPGRTMVTDGKILIGIINGNIFIGLRLRAFGERAMELYHSTDSTPPLSYIAYYRWLAECFGANAVYHIGTHGSLEWLPGKEVGLIALLSRRRIGASLMYPYHIGITGEGIQASAALGGHSGSHSPHRWTKLKPMSG